MLEQRIFAISGVNELRALINGYSWATLVSAVDSADLVVSHLPILLDANDPGLSVLGHLARADANIHELGKHQVVLIIQGPHGYVSPTWYKAGPYVPTWNFVVVHLHGRPELLDEEETYSVLSATVDHFEAARPEPWRLDSVVDYARRIAPGTTGFRMKPSRIVGKAKLSQDKPADVAKRVIEALESDPYQGQPEVAAAIRQHLNMN